jgi:hypothetical protein
LRELAADAGQQKPGPQQAKIAMAQRRKKPTSIHGVKLSDRRRAPGRAQRFERFEPFERLEQIIYF